MAAIEGSTAGPEPGFEPIVYSPEELTAMREVKALLLSKHGIAESRIGLCALAVATINTKLRVEETASKYAKWLGPSAPSASTG